MAHFGSCSATEVKMRRASSQKNECSNATPRANSDWTAGVHDIGKSTFPAARKSPGSGTVAHPTSLIARRLVLASPIRRNMRRQQRDILEATSLCLCRKFGNGLGGYEPTPPRSCELALSQYSQRVLPFEQGRMRVIKTAVERMRGEITQVFFAQFAQRLNE